MYSEADIAALRHAYPDDHIPADPADLVIYLATKDLEHIQGELQESLQMFDLAHWDQELAVDHMSLLFDSIVSTNGHIQELELNGHSQQAGLLKEMRQSVIRSLGPVLARTENLAVPTHTPGHADAAERFQAALAAAQRNLASAAGPLQHHIDDLAQPPPSARAAAARSRGTSRAAGAQSATSRDAAAPAPSPTASPRHR
ncbi:hypothetical protein [Kitasatospora sp. NRRL B-11411]|uniref:hypothetical protein n=1 Tax=Kitasatospora sp. NRRL B-11411 TaxID=1463822 RepID=UPI0004C46D4D|nr:hypothetical protein [Kitasatospora sp. NRRL B-11411]